MFSSNRPLPQFAVGAVCLGVFALMPLAALADPVPSFNELAERVDQSPYSREAGALQDAAEARVRQAGVRPNPTIGIETESVLGTGAYSGFSNAETTLSFSQELELWGRRSARVDAARADAGAATLRRDLVVADSFGRLALAYAEAEAAQRLSGLAQEALELTRADTDAVLIQVEEGRQPRLRAIQAEAEAASAQATFEEAKAEKEAAFARLSVIAMLPSSGSEITHTLLDQLSPVIAQPSADVPAIRVAEAEQRAAEKRISVEQTLARPDLTANVGVRRSEIDNATAMTFGFSLPLPLFDQNRGNIQAAQAEYHASTARLEAVKQQVQIDREAALARLRSSASRVAAADTGVSTAEEAYELSRIGFDSGRLSQPELLLSREALISAKRASVDARLTRVVAEIDLARLEGRIPFGGKN